MFATQEKLYAERARKFIERLNNRYLSDSIRLETEFAPSKDPVPFAERMKLKYKKITEGSFWGRDWESAWFHVTGTVPKAWKGKEIILFAELGSEAMVFGPDGVPLQGLTAGSVYSENFKRKMYLPLIPMKPGSKVEFWIEGAANSLFGMNNNSDPELDETSPYGHFDAYVNLMRLAVLDRETWELARDAEIVFGLYNGNTAKSFWKQKYLLALSAAEDAFAEDPVNASKARKELKKILSTRANASAMTVHAVGHAHIDTGWLWPVRETVRKCARTFSSQLVLMEQYPDYVFGASAAQHYAFIKKYYPGLYPKLRAAVKSGRWEIQGGMWVEADCNIPSGESLVRQFVKGKNFFMDEFGFDVKNLWIPDVFGYAASLPQIIRKSGCEYFLTQKISWSQFNQFPYNSFHWKGIDGTSILTHFPPEDSYNSMLHADQLAKAADNYREGAVSGDFMSLFGVGDGGGGPTPEIIARGMRQRDLEGAPKLKFDRADNFFEVLRKSAGEKLPEWKGELYLELHRGTLTTQARTKRANRKNEQLLIETEFILAHLPVKDYPARQLDETWKLLLINQFHDIIPGSSIGMVYENTLREHEKIRSSCEEMIRKAAKKIFKAAKDSLVLVNSLSYASSQLVALPSGWKGASGPDGKLLPCQEENGIVYASVLLPASSFVTLKKSEGKILRAKAGRGLVLENELVRYEFSPEGALLSAYDKELGKEFLEAGKRGNEFSLYTDRPANYEAWDVDVYYKKCLLEHAKSASSPVKLEGKLRSSLAFELKIGNSLIHQKIVLENGTKRLDFRTEVDWHENRKMLRTSFPLSFETDRDSFDIQYGYLQRTTHNNTSWDYAQFEVSCQRYADSSTPEFGAALLNDCKYGCCAKGNILDLNLLRSPKHPDWDADQGKQLFTYSFLPHAGDLIHSDVIREAAILNRPCRVLENCSSANLKAIASLECDNASLEVVKKAEKSGKTVLRIVETKGIEGKGRLKLGIPCRKLVKTNLLEWTHEGEIPVRNGEAVIELKPFAIETFILQ